MGRESLGKASWPCEDGKRSWRGEAEAGGDGYEARLFWVGEISLVARGGLFEVIEPLR